MTFRRPNWTGSPDLGFDWVWLLSVWQTGQAGQRVSRTNPEWRKEFQETLPDLREDDIPGSGFRHHRIHGARKPGRGCSFGPTAPAAPPTRPAADARLRSQPHRAGSPLGRRTPRVLHPWHGIGPGPRPQELYLGQAQARRSAAGPRTRPVLPRLAGHLATQLRQPGHAGSHDRRVGEDRRAV